MSLCVALAGAAFWTHTGYGVPGKHLLTRLRDQLGHDVALFAWFGLKGGMQYQEGIPIYPGGDDPFGHDVLGQHAAHFGADLVITLIDIWVYPPSFHRSLHGVPWAPWFPLDHAPPSPPLVARARQAEYPLSYSQFGVAQMAAAGVECSHVPIGVETQTVFVPGDKRAARAVLDLPQEAFLCSMVAANVGQPSRKAFAEQLSAFAHFRRRHSEAALYLHTILTPRDGVHLPSLCASLGLGEGAVYWPDQYLLKLGLPEDYMALVYQASDVLLGAACGEGFGLPLVEAQSCGTPVITTDFSSMPELTINGIATTPAQMQWCPLGAWQAVPSIAAIATALEQVYGWGAGKRRRNAERGRAFVVEHLDWDVLVRERWAPFLTRVEAERGEGQPLGHELVEMLA